MGECRAIRFGPPQKATVQNNGPRSAACHQSISRNWRLNGWCSMGYVVNALTAIVTTVLGRQIYDSGPRLSSWLIKKAARRLPVDADRKRREEEWLAHLHDAPGISGLYHASGSFLASYRMYLPFEAVIVRCILWLIYYSIEIGLDFFVMKPYCKKVNSAATAMSKQDSEKALEFICKIAALKIIYRLGRRNLPNVDASRSKLRETLSSFATVKAS